MSHGVVVSTPVAGSAVTTARTWPAVVAFEADEAAVHALARDAGRWHADGHGAAQVDAGRVQALRGARRHETRQVVARTDRVDLGGAGRDDHLVGMDVEHAVPGPGDDRRAGVDGHDLVAVRGLQDEDVLAGGAGRGRGGQSARSPTDDDDLDLAPFHVDVRSAWGPRHVRLRHDGEWRVRAIRVAHDLETRPARRLAGPDVGDAVDRREAVRAVAGQAQRPATSRLLAAAEHGERDRVARLEGHGPSIHDDPAAGGRRGPGRLGWLTVSVTGASASRPGRSSGVAGAGPVVVGR